jgi:hypothetical protein
VANKEVQDLIRKLQEQGWRIEEGKHYKAFPPDTTKPMVVIPKTPSDHRSLKNTIAQLRRSGAII